MKKRIPIVILILAPYLYWCLGIYFLLDRGGLSEKALVPILCTFVIFLIVILVPCLVYSLIQIRKGFTPKNMLISGIVMFGTMIPIWIMSIIVSIAMVTTILLSVLVPVILFIDCAFAIPGLLLILVGGARCIWSKKADRES